ncbi:hypothetical protein HPB50_012276 [Hyalomma asiaticum]|uniref:Uncharacterized protein n=1 Tax=Hyalomma asiaticum TaxID=266040 RepID=A0ACB7SBZ9_HYAAI|nr:hypothetical protein HPB50_012276 [Hyalomma asiaticum]
MSDTTSASNPDLRGFRHRSTPPPPLPSFQSVSFSLAFQPSGRRTPFIRFASLSLPLSSLNQYPPRCVFFPLLAWDERDARRLLLMRLASQPWQRRATASAAAAVAIAFVSPTRGL